MEEWKEQSKRKERYTPKEPDAVCRIEELAFFDALKQNSRIVLSERSLMMYLTRKQ